MKLLSVGKFIEKTNYRENIQDYKTWKAMGRYFEEIYLVVESPDSVWHYESVDNINITWIPKKKKPYEFFYFIHQSYLCCKKLIKEKNIDVIDAGEPICAGLMCVGLKKNVKKDFVVQVQGQLFNLPSSYSWLRRKLIGKITKYVCQHAERLRVVSEEIRKSAIENGIDKEKIYISPSRCDMEIFDSRKYQKEAYEIRKSYGCQNNDFVMIFVGRLIPAKDVSSILEAIAEIIKRYKNIKALIVGSGELEPELKEKSKKLQLENHVFFCGMIPYTEIPTILAAGDIFVSPSLDEGLSRSVLEAMAMELAVIVTPVGGNPEIIRNGETGYFVAVKNPKQIAERIIYLMKHPDEMKRIQKNARQRIADHYEFHKCIKSFADIHYF